MNSLSFYNPRLTSDIFDVIDRNLASLMQSNSNNQFFSPKTDIRETADQYILDMDLPGVSEKDIEISLKNRILSISSKKETEDKTKEGEWHLKERHSMEFSRKFTLPQDIDMDKVSAEFKDGVLSIYIFKKPEIEAKQIQINVN